MTRCNLVPPSELADQHLFAEFRELKMFPKSLARSLRARGIGGVLGMVPREYCLGKGHVSFFYDKGRYLYNRYDAIRYELRRRGINYDMHSQLDPDNVFRGMYEQQLYNLYIPTDAALALIRARIAEKVAMKPLWYRKTSYVNPMLGVA
jgi:deoxyribonuclease (pyrimidine dimer)